MSEMRKAGQFVPTLMLTARGHPEDILKGFAAGADDYLTKPFELTILIARIRGLLRRREWLRADTAPAEKTAPRRSRDVFHLRRQVGGFRSAGTARARQIFPLTLMEANVLRYLIAA